jgi:polysaccharide export outer membrane protein
MGLQARFFMADGHKLARFGAYFWSNGVSRTLPRIRTTGRWPATAMMAMSMGIRSTTALRVGTCLLLLFLMSACSTVNSGLADQAAVPAELRLAPGDKIRVTVFGEDRLSGEFQIDNAGSLSLPLAGTIEGAGLTKNELEQSITTQLRNQYLRNPKVTVDVVSYRPFFILGEVQKPGEYPFRSGLNVLSAIAIAGGATYRANPSKVLIQRSGSNDEKEYPQSPTVVVMPGDVVRVPERFF